MREKFFCLFQNLSEKRSDVRKTFLAADLNCIIHIQRNFFGNFSWGSVTHAVIFELFEKDFGGFSETVFYERWGSSWKKTFFPKEMSIPKLFGAWAKFFWIVGNKLRQGSQNLIHWLQMNSLRKTMFSKKSWFFFLPHTLTQKHSENGKTFRVRSLDCINTVQKHTLDEQFEKNNVFRKKLILFSSSHFDTKTFGKWQNISSAFSRLHKHSPKAHLREFFFHVQGSDLSI